ncbi:MAG: hypothetical protein J6C81_06035 [Muribaculaceae bacterium]|nr:hypothetical protein [Muribaculaceae bacterium]
MKHFVNKYIHSLKRLAAGVFTAGIAAIALTGCVNDDLPPCPGGYDPSVPEGMVQLTLKLVAGQNPFAEAGTRAWPDDYQIGSVAENRINAENDDFRILLFSGDGKYLKTFQKETVNGVDTNYPIPVVPSYYTYEVKMLLTDKEVEANPQVKIMVLANLNSFGKEDGNEYAALDMALADGSLSTVEEVMKLPLNFYMADFNNTDEGLPGSEFRNNYWLDNWAMDPQTSFIPMFGCKQFSLYTGVSSEYNALDLGDMFLLRSMAKIEVMDILNRDAGSDLPRVEEVAFYGYNQTGTLIPSPDIYSHGEQVKTPTYPQIPNPNGQNISLVPFTLPGGTYAWYGYYPETPLPLNDSERDKLVMSAKIKYINGEGNEAVKTCTFDLIDADEWSQTAGLKALLRNHIYRLNIVGFSNDGDEGFVGIQYWTVCPWVKFPDVDIPPFE